MLWLKIGWRNIWRNKRRSFIELSSIAGGVFIAVAYNNLAQGMYGGMIEQGVRVGSGHVGIYADGYLEERKLAQGFDPTPVIENIKNEADAKGVFTRIYVPGLSRSSHGSRPTAILGMDIENEKDSNPLFKPEHIQSGSFPKPGNSRTIKVIIGSRLATDLKLKVGKKFVWTGQDTTGELASKLMRVAAIIHTGVKELDAGTVIADRHAVAQIIGKDSFAHEVAVMLESTDEISVTLEHLRPLIDKNKNINIYPWEEAMPALAGAIRTDYAGLQIIVFFIYFLVAIGTINTMLMSVMERTREFGVLRSLGVSSTNIRSMILVESFVLGSVGVAIGLICSTAIGFYTFHHGWDLTEMMGDGAEMAGVFIDPIMYSIWDIPGTVLFSGMMIAIALIAALYPAHRALKINPADAMRRY